ncbi:hypothetical protein [Candidatus Villigracilis affinis]|uniref:hypothetical protein n=1 Tax=Candidatus Villigracilis affinis TaxID=3140682 RepID=UPI002A1D205B|nr:hypothetical protein [Anaerolineales bacterium]
MAKPEFPPFNTSAGFSGLWLGTAVHGFLWQTAELIVLSALALALCQQPTWHLPTSYACRCRPGIFLEVSISTGILRAVRVVCAQKTTPT